MPDRYLIPETMDGLFAFQSDHAALLVALRALVTRQPDSVGLTVMAATLLTAMDPAHAGDALVAAFETDPTLTHAEDVGNYESQGCVVIDSVGSGPDGVLCPNGASAMVRHAHETERTTAVVTPFGSRLPKQLWANYLSKTSAGRGDGLGGEVLPWSTFDELIGPSGPAELDTWEPDCAEAPEITRW